MPTLAVYLTESPKTAHLTTTLLPDDTPHVLGWGEVATAIMVLERENYHVTTAFNGQEAATPSPAPMPEPTEPSPMTLERLHNRTTCCSHVAQIGRRWQVCGAPARVAIGGEPVCRVHADFPGLRRMRDLGLYIRWHLQTCATA